MQPFDPMPVVVAEEEAAQLPVAGGFGKGETGEELGFAKSGGEIEFQKIFSDGAGAVDFDQIVDAFFFGARLAHREDDLTGMIDGGKEGE